MIAWTELYMTLAHTMTRFELELFDTEVERDILTARDFFVTVPRKDSQGIRAKVTKIL